MTRVIAAVTGFNACTYYRLQAPAEVLREQGHDITVQEVTDRVLEARVNAEVVIFARPQHRLVAEAIPCLRAAGIRTVVELDDLFEDLPEGHPMRGRVDPQFNAENNWQWTRKCVELADELVATTSAICDAYGRGVVVPNYVPASYLSVSRRPPGPPARRYIGWPGDSRHHVGGMDVCRAGMQAVCPPNRFLALGARTSLVELSCSGEYVGFVPIEDYPALLAQRLDVGIAPLADNRFNAGKSSLKSLTFASLGIPFVCSPSIEYKALGLGRFASTDSEWEEHLRELVTAPANALTAEGARLRETVRERGLTYEERAGEFWHAWTGRSENAP